MSTAKPKSDSALRFAPLTPKRWPDLERLFGPRGAASGCWCMWGTLPRAEYRRGCGEPNKRAFRRRVADGAVPGLLAYRDGEPVGWCAVEPRERYEGLAQSRLHAPLDAKPVWLVKCFYVRAGQRRQGVSLALLREAKRFVAARGGRLIEGHPLETEDAFPGASWMGVASTFAAAGFREVARRSPTRPILRAAVRRR